MSMNHDVMIVGACRVNTYVFDDGKHAVIVDPGAEPEKIVSYVRKHGLEIKYIVITHAHFDHVGAVAKLKESFPHVKVYMPKDDFDILERDGFISHCSFDIPIDPFTVDVKVVDGDIFNLCGHNFRTVATPGHTVGSVCYIVDDEILLSGDTLFRSSVGRTDLRYGDFEALHRSLKKILSFDKDYVVLPGHEESTTLFFEREYNPYV